MTNSTRFAVAVHILALLARRRPSAVTSEKIAASVGTNPAVARRLVSQLSAAGITECRLGKGGGATLARPAKKITLLDVFRAVEDSVLVMMPKSAPNKDCPVGCQILAALTKHIAPAETAFFETLNGVTLKQFVKALKT